MIAHEWPNKLGFDVGSTEVWKLRESFGVRVFSNGDPYKSCEVPYSRTTDALEAAKIAKQEGLVIE